MRTMYTTAAAALLTLCAAAPVAGQDREHQQIAAELRMLQEQQQQLAISLAQLAEAVNAIGARIDEAPNVTRKGFADQSLVLDATAVDLRNIRERLDDSNVRLGTLGEEVKAIRTAISTLAQLQTQVQQLQQMQQTQQTQAPPADGSTSTPLPSPPVVVPAPTIEDPPPSTAGLSPTRTFQQAFADYAAGQYTLATSGFEAFLRYWPTSERADDAQFYIGETAAAQNRFDDAIAAYNAVIMNYPAEDQVPLAYYKRGTAYERLGQTDQARASWEAVVTLYPDSDGGRLAKQRLEGQASATPQPATPPR